MVLVLRLFLLGLILTALTTRSISAFQTQFIRPTFVFRTHIATPHTRQFHQSNVLQFSSPLFNNNNRITSAILEKNNIPDASVVSAVERLSRTTPNGVLPADVAAAAGISLDQARQELTRLAAIAQADLAVSNDGDLIYRFPPNLAAVLSQNSAQYQALQTFRQVWPTAFWLIRVTFGVTLVASLVAIFSTIFFLQTSSSSSDDDRRRDDRGFGGGGGLGWYFGPSPFDFFYYRPYGAYGYYNNPQQDPEDMGFLESVFSYVFGDGDPNTGLEGRRLALAANMIRRNKGAVTAEQLAPFVDDAPDTDKVKDVTYVDESFVLPIVSALGGEPVVSDEGEIVYVFDELQSSATTSDTATRALQLPSKESQLLKRVGMSPKASNREIVQLLQYNGISTRGARERTDLIQLLEDAMPPMTAAEEAEAVDADPTLLQEREYRFSLASDTNKLLAGGLGIVNLGGVLYLGTLLARYSVAGIQLPSWFGLVQAGYPFLLGYGVLYNCIPLFRRFWIQRQNAQIQDRNRRRRRWRDALQATNSRFTRKLKQAAKLGRRMKRVGASEDDIVYDTKKTTISELEANKAKRDMEEFDKLLEEGGDEKPFQ